MGSGSTVERATEGTGTGGDARAVAPAGLGPGDATAAPGRRRTWGLVALLAGAGILHLAAPRPYDAIVPRWVPGRARGWTYASGVAELAVAAALAVPRTRRAGAAAAAALFVAVFPANLQMAWDWRTRGLAARVLAVGRLPLQVPLVLWAMAVRRGVPTR